MLLVFDLDGTLFQAKPIFLSALRELFEDLGLSVPDEDTIIKYARRDISAMLHDVLPSGADLTGTRLLYKDIISKAITDKGELFPGVKEMLVQLNEDGHTLFVCSNSPREYISKVLTHTGIHGLISRFCSTADSAMTKATAVKGLIIRPYSPESPAIVIGDTHQDIAAAHENGLLAIAVNYGYGNKQMLEKADYFADSPAEIVKIISQW